MLRLVWDINDLILPPCGPEVLDGRHLIQEVRPYRTSRFQSCSGVKVNIGEQREFRFAYSVPLFFLWFPLCRDEAGLFALIIIIWCHLSADVSRAMLLRTGSQSVLVHRTAQVMDLMVLSSCTSTRLVCATLLQTGALYSCSHRIAEGQG